MFAGHLRNIFSHNAGNRETIQKYCLDLITYLYNLPQSSRRDANKLADWETTCC